ncbi:hypothetical protein [Aurantiacibacter poecillastricola]|uniref:hypothetical protein n=1 Tax=Aurantiacibacter poecillastricola TaxID=3064385 RepID=UPI00273E552F|nr:hypothetical protein [Aurantiacibacter sp. 219JJ12-13]MDP5263023.1 hypothetical protein [Aurantiacibacter sp. 219JJ12-13]
MGTSEAWTPERRAKQAQAIRRWKPWKKSTGPRTSEGKARSSRNADRGVAAVEARILEARLRVQSEFAASAEDTLASMIASCIIK